MLKFIITNIVLLLTFSIAPAALALTSNASTSANTTTTTHQQQPIAVATVNIQNTKLSQQGNTLNISFDLTNRTGVQPDVRFAVELVSQVNGAQSVADEKVYPDVVQLGENSRVHENVTYTAPAGLSGTYQVVVISQNSNGFPFGIAIAGSAKFASTDGVALQPNSCYLEVAGDKSATKYTLRQGVDISPSETLELTCTATNVSTVATQAIPQFETHYRTSFGPVVEQHDVSATPISFNAKETKTVTITLPKAYEPQAYDINVNLKSGSTLSNTIVVHYVLRGASATIQSVTLDKDYYSASDQAALTFIWSPSADSFYNSRGGASPSATTYTATLTSGSGASCAAPLSGNLTSTRMMTSIPITATCANPHLSLVLKDANGTVLAQKDIAFQSSGTSTNSTWVLVVILLLCCLILFAIFKYNRHMAVKVLLPLIMVAGIAAGAGIPLHYASADTFCVGGNQNYLSGGGGWDPCMYEFTANLDQSSYAPGQAITTTGQVVSDVCDNQVVNGTDISSAEIDGLAPYSGESHVLFQGDVSALSHGKDVSGNCGFDQCYGAPSYGSAQFTAPNSAGQYAIHVTGIGYYLDSNYNQQSSSNSIDLPFTVTGPVCVQNQGSACNSSANSCGQTAQGTVNCDGSCSASTPACTCPTGQTLGSNGTCVPIQCPTGQQLDSSGVCEPIQCPTGQTLNGNNCVPIQCPTGQMLSGNNCVPIQCPSGQTLVGNNCVTACQPGEQLNSSGVCVPITCPTGQVLNNSGVCVPNNCPQNESMNSSGVCVAGSCPSGQVLNASGACVTPASCPSGQVLNASGVCIPAPCPSGQTRNSSGVCTSQSQCVSSVGSSCTSAANSCGLTNTGVVNCDGSCSVSAPSNSQCPSTGTSQPGQLTLVASPSRVRSGTATLLTWSASGVQSCTVTGTNGFHDTGTSGTNVNSGPINQQTTFTFTCSDSSGNTQSITQTVEPLPVVQEQ